MRLFSLLFLVFGITFSSHGANKKPLVLDEPVVNYIAEAAANHLKRVQTIGGFLVWAENYMTREEVASVRKWLTKNSIEESDYFPSFQVRKNTISYGRDRMTINNDSLIINGKTYKISSDSKTSFISFLDQVCKDLKCQKRKTSMLEASLIPEARAFPWLIAGLAFVGGWITGRWWNRKGKYWWRNRRNRRNQCRGAIVGCRSTTIINEELVDRNQGENYRCQSGQLVLEGRNGYLVSVFNRQGERIVIPQAFYSQQFSNCEEAARAINQYASHNSNQFSEPAEGFRSVSGEGEKEPPPKKKAQ